MLTGRAVTSFVFLLSAATFLLLLVFQLLQVEAKLDALHFPIFKRLITRHGYLDAPLFLLVDDADFPIDDEAVFGAYMPLLEFFVYISVLMLFFDWGRQGIRLLGRDRLNRPVLMLAEVVSLA